MVESPYSRSQVAADHSRPTPPRYRDLCLLGAMPRQIYRVVIKPLPPTQELS